MRCTVCVIVKDLAKEGALDEKQRRSLKMLKPPDVYGHITYRCRLSCQHRMDLDHSGKTSCFEPEDVFGGFGDISSFMSSICGSKNVQ